MFVPTCREVKAITRTESGCLSGWGCGEEWSPSMEVLRMPGVGLFIFSYFNQQTEPDNFIYSFRKANRFYFKVLLVHVIVYCKEELIRETEEILFIYCPLRAPVKCVYK